MSDIFSSAEQFWDNLLSRDPDKILEAFQSLHVSSRPSVLQHLRVMVTEEGWQLEQIASAQVALAVLQKEPLFRE
ncbi:MAG: hypothetical protein AB9891_11480 [Anaerolineaceae bacterium]